MRRQMYTVFTGKKYPKFYPAMLASTLAPYKINLFCLTDQEPLRLHVTNLVYIHIDDLYEGWWGKLKFFDPTLVEEALVVDIDSLFLSDPEPIFTWLENRRPDMAFITEPMKLRGKTGIGTSMFYVNGESNIPRRALEIYKKGDFSPKRGDQDFLDMVFRPNEWMQFPRHFQVQYKCLTDNPAWKGIGERVYQSTDINHFISVHFNGKPLPHEVISKKMDHWGVLKACIPGWEGIIA